MSDKPTVHDRRSPRIAEQMIRWLVKNQDRINRWAWGMLLADAALMLALIIPRIILHVLRAG